MNREEISNQGDERYQDEPLMGSVTSDGRGYDIDQLINKAGGFGRMQWILLSFAICSYQGLNFFLYNFAYLELVPRLMCSYNGDGNFVECSDPKDVCINGDLKPQNYWYEDFSDDFSFHNWMTDLNLYCKSGFMIGLLGSVYFIGFAINGLLLKQSDYIGRKGVIIIGSFLQIIC